MQVAGLSNEVPETTAEPQDPTPEETLADTTLEDTSDEKRAEISENTQWTMCEEVLQYWEVL